MNSGGVAALVDEDRRKPMKVFAAHAVMPELAQMMAYHLDDRTQPSASSNCCARAAFPCMRR